MFKWHYFTKLCHFASIRAEANITTTLSHSLPLPLPTSLSLSLSLLLSLGISFNFCLMLLLSLGHSSLPPLLSPPLPHSLSSLLPLSLSLSLSLTYLPSTPHRQSACHRKPRGTLLSDICHKLRYWRWGLSAASQDNR